MQGAAVWLSVMAGSALGGAARHAVSVAGERWTWLGMPWPTLTVNVIGGALIGAFAALQPRPGGLSEPFFVVGLLGGFTTFSAFSLQTLRMIQAGQWPTALGYVALSVVLTVLAAGIAHQLVAR